jgi:hypothetical protein
MQQTIIKIKNGQYRNQVIMNEQFILHRGFSTLKTGSYVTVKNDTCRFGDIVTKARIKIESVDDIELVSGNHSDLHSSEVEVEEIVNETDDQIMDRIRDRFSVLTTMTSACIDGHVRAMIVQGAPGVGKTQGIANQLEYYYLSQNLASGESRYEFVRGNMSALGLFAKLYEYRQAGKVLVIDDCDEIYSDENAMNILKSSLDSGKIRTISWNKDSRYLQENGIPNSFDFEASVIFVTNKDFTNPTSKKMQPHFEALMSRSHFIDLTIRTDRERLLRIFQVHRDCNVTGGLFASYDFDEELIDEIFEFFEENYDKMREVSIRTVLKIADLVKVDRREWRNLAKATVCG